jgi:hypothetical protein
MVGVRASQSILGAVKRDRVRGGGFYIGGICSMAVDAPRINGWLRLTIFLSSSNGTMQIPLDYKVTGTQPSISDLAQIAFAFWSANANIFKAALNLVYNVDHILAETRYAGTNYQYDYFPAQPQPGTGTGDASPSSAAVVLSKKSGATGRSFNGRLFMPGIGENSINHDTIGTSWITTLTTVANAILLFRGAAGVSQTWEAAVASKKLLVLVPFLTMVINNIIDSQRRRLTGRGR